MPFHAKASVLTSKCFVGKQILISSQQGGVKPRNGLSSSRYNANASSNGQPVFSLAAETSFKRRKLDHPDKSTALDIDALASDGARSANKSTSSNTRAQRIETTTSHLFDGRVAEYDNMEARLAFKHRGKRTNGSRSAPLDVDSETRSPRALEVEETTSTNTPQAKVTQSPQPMSSRCQSHQSLKYEGTMNLEPPRSRATEVYNKFKSIVASSYDRETQPERKLSGPDPTQPHQQVVIDSEATDDRILSTPTPSDEAGPKKRTDAQISAAEVEEIEDSGDDLLHKPSSDIPSTNFKSRSSIRAGVQKKSRRPKKGRYKLELIQTKGFFATSVYLIMDEQDRSFKPEFPTQRFLSEFSCLVIGAEALQILHAYRPDFVQVKFPRRGLHDSAVDLRFCQEKEGNDFVKKMQEWYPLLKVEACDNERMEKIFLRREAEFLRTEQTDKNEVQFSDLEDRSSQSSAVMSSHVPEKRRKIAQVKEVAASEVKDAQSKPKDLFLHPPHIKRAPNGRTPLVSEMQADMRRTRATRKSHTGTEATNEESKPPLKVIHKYSEDPGLGVKWESPLVYPPTGRDRAIVDFSDLPRLDEDEWLNDNLIAFYAKYLEKTVKRNSADKIHIFNTFFNKQLSDTKGLPRGSHINYDRVQKWTKIDIFDHDFLVVPICANAHWWMAIICNLSNLTRTVIEEPEGKDKVPSPTTAQLSSVGVDEVIDEVSSPVMFPIHEVNNDVDLLAPSTTELSNLTLDDADPEVFDDNAASKKREDNETAVANSVVDLSEPTSPLTPIESDVPPKERRTLRTYGTKNVTKASAYKQQSSGRTSQKSQGGGKRPSLDDPLLMSLDSLAITRSSELGLLKEFIIEEGKSKRGLAIAKSQLSGMTATGLPQQSTSSDCGVYVLAYLKRFLENPRGFVNKLISRQFDEKMDWNDLDANKIRAEIRDTIFQVHAEQNEVPTASQPKKPKLESTGPLPKPQPQIQTAAEDIQAWAKNVTQPVAKEIAISPYFPQPAQNASKNQAESSLFDRLKGTSRQTESAEQQITSSSRQASSPSAKPLSSPHDSPRSNGHTDLPISLITSLSKASVEHPDMASGNVINSSSQPARLNSDDHFSGEATKRQDFDGQVAPGSPLRAADFTSFNEKVVEISANASRNNKKKKAGRPGEARESPESIWEEAKFGAKLQIVTEADTKPLLSAPKSPAIERRRRSGDVDGDGDLLKSPEPRRSPRMVRKNYVELSDSP